MSDVHVTLKLELFKLFLLFRVPALITLRNRVLFGVWSLVYD